MKITSLRISNVLSFKYYLNIAEAPEIKFDKDLNILIGQNGSGKSTALEVINFIFRKVLFVQYTFNEEAYINRAAIRAEDRRTFFQAANNNTYNQFRLEHNWNYEEKPQKIRIEVLLDEVDQRNLELLKNNQDKLSAISSFYYTSELNLNFESPLLAHFIEITLDKANNNFVLASPTQNDSGYQYLVKYNFLKQLINIHNLENPKIPVEELYESFVLISSFRNYHAFNPSVSLQQSYASRQMQDIRVQEYQKSLNANEQAEPSVFSLVRLRIAEIHYNLILQNFTNTECEDIANREPFLIAINKRLKMVNLKVEIKLADQRLWSYSFSFFDLKRNSPIGNINSLSAGQKSIIHLVFEAYGRGDLHGGLVIIDEPEIHLHHQFQDEYIRVIEEINKDQKCQYILVTHSESLINSNTISKVQRFALDEDNFTIIKSPTITSDKKTLVKILDNTRSTFAFFAQKIILVEGDTDRYFFKAAFKELKPELNQSIAILDMSGKGNYFKWKEFFEEFGLQVYLICDFDNVFTLDFSGHFLVKKEDKNQFNKDIKQSKLDTLNSKQQTELERLHKQLLKDPNFLAKPNRDTWKALIDFYNNLIKVSNEEMVAKTKSVYTKIDDEIELKYADKIFILKKGNIETYLGTTHGKIDKVVEFCEKNLKSWLQTSSVESAEIKTIINLITR